MELTELARRFTCVLRDGRLEVVAGAGTVAPWLTAAPGDDLIAALRAVGRSDAPARLAAWVAGLREAGAAQASIAVVVPGGVRGALTVTAVETGDGHHAVAVRFGAPEADPRSRGDGRVPDLRSALERLDEVCYELRRMPGERWAATYVSPGWERLHGRPIPDDPVERSDAWLASIHPDDIGRATAAALDGTTRREPLSHDYRIIRSDGEVRWVRDRITGFSGDGAPRVTGVCIDITEQKLRDLRLVELVRAVSELLDHPGAALPEDLRRRLRALLSSRDPRDVAGSSTGVTDGRAPAETASGVYEMHLGVDGEWRNDHLSPVAREILGGDIPDDPRRRAAVCIERMHADDVRRALAALTEAVVTGRPTVAEYRVVPPRGGTRRVRTTFVRVSRAPVRLTGVITDISGTGPGPASGRLRDPVRRAPVAEGPEEVVVEFAVSGGDVTPRYASRAAAVLLGMPDLAPGAARAAAWMGAVDPRDRPGLLADIRAAERGAVVRGARRVRTAGGGVRWVRTELHRAAPGAVTCVASDITDLAEALAPDAVPDGGRFARIVASVPDGLWEVVVHDAAAGVCEFSFASARLWDILGMEPAEAFRLGDLLAEAVPPEDRPLSRDQFRRLLRREDVSVAEHRIVRPDGTVRWVRWTALGRFGDDGVVRLVGTIRDVTGEIVRPPARAAERIAGLPPLTARQREVLDHLASGASTDEIARAMGIRPVTVANHVAALLRRLGVRSRLEAVAMVLGQATGERWLSGAVPGPGDRDVPGPVG